MKSKSEIKSTKTLNKLLDEFIESNTSIELVGLSTSDGFVIGMRRNERITVEFDKISAIASSLCSLSDSAAASIINQSFLMTTVETESGNILFLRTKYLHYSCVVCIAVKEDLSLAQTRFISLRLTDAIAGIIAKVKK